MSTLLMQKAFFLCPLLMNSRTFELIQISIYFLLWPQKKIKWISVCLHNLKDVLFLKPTQTKAQRHLENVKLAVNEGFKA